MGHVGHGSLRARSVRRHGPASGRAGGRDLRCRSNWCGGKTLFDDNGCAVGYMCANGDDPCTTDPCQEDSACEPNELCIDELCWYAISCNTHGGYYTPQGCGGTWSCDNGNEYASDCEDQGDTISCTCIENGVDVGGCTASAPEYCEIAYCCGFPVP